MCIILFYFQINVLTPCCFVCADRPPPTNTGAKIEGEAGGSQQPAENMSFNLDFLARKRAAGESSGIAAKRQKVPDTVDLEREAPPAPKPKNSPEPKKALEPSAKPVPEPKKKDTVQGAPTLSTATEQGIVGSSAVSSSDQPVDQPTVFDSVDVSWARNPDMVTRAEVDRVEHNSVIRLVKDINQDLSKVKTSFPHFIFGQSEALF